MAIRDAIRDALSRKGLRLTCDTGICISAESDDARITVFLGKDGSVQAVTCETPDTSDIIRLRESRKRGTLIEVESSDDLLVFRIAKGAYSAEIRI